MEYTPRNGGIDEILQIYHVRITGWNIRLFTKPVNYLLQEVLHRPRFLWYQDSEDEHILPLVYPSTGSGQTVIC